MRYDFSTNEYVYTRVNGSVYRCKDSFPSIVQPFWQNDPKEFDLEKKITWDEIAPSLQELIIRKIKFSDLDDPLQNRIIKIETDIANNYTNLNNRLLAEVQYRTNGDGLLQEQVDSLKRRMTSAESRLTVLENRMDEAERQIYLIWIEIRKLWEEIYDIWGSDGKDNSHNITEIWKKIEELEQEISMLFEKLGELEEAVDNNMSITITKDAGWRHSASTGQVGTVGPIPREIGDWEYFLMEAVTADAKSVTKMTLTQRWSAFFAAPSSGKFYVTWDSGCAPYASASEAGHYATGDEISILSIDYTGWHNCINVESKHGWENNPYNVPRGHSITKSLISGNFNAGDKVYVAFLITGYGYLQNFSKDGLPDYNVVGALQKIQSYITEPGYVTYTDPENFPTYFRVDPA